MKVLAAKVGYYGETLRQVGDEFELSSDRHFSKKWMKEVADAGPGADQGDPGQSGLSEMKVPDLKQMAKELDIDGVDVMKKSDLIEAISKLQDQESSD